MTICLKQILFHQEQLKSNLKELFSHFGKYVKQYTNIFAEVGELLPVASPSQKGLMSANIYKTSTAHTLPPNKKVRIISRDKYVETILEFVGRSVFEEFVHLIIKHANQQVNIEKGTYNNAPDERIEYKFYYDSSSVYIITPSNKSTIRLVGTTNKDNIKYEEMSDMNIDGLTPIILS